eukprot:3390300-Amphidinium_carterae.1
MGDVSLVSMSVSWTVYGWSGEGVVVVVEVLAVVEMSVAEKSAESPMWAWKCVAQWLSQAELTCAGSIVTVEESPMRRAAVDEGVKCQGEVVVVVVGEGCDDWETLVDGGKDALRGHGTMLEVFVKTTCQIQDVVVDVFELLRWCGGGSVLVVGWRRFVGKGCDRPVVVTGWRGCRVDDHNCQDWAMIRLSHAVEKAPGHGARVRAPTHELW